MINQDHRLVIIDPDGTTTDVEPEEQINLMGQLRQLLRVHEDAKPDLVCWAGFISVNFGGHMVNMAVDEEGYIKKLEFNPLATSLMVDSTHAPIVGPGIILYGVPLE